jgi:2'-5' RNA ligase
MRRTEDTIRQREVVSRTAQKRAPITAHGSSGCYVDKKILGSTISLNRILDNNSYIIAEIEDPAMTEILNLRKKYDNVTAQLPVEITLAGSSGVGPISPGQSIDSIINQIDRILDSVTPFTFTFKDFNRFENTKIFFLEPSDRKEFDKLHSCFSESSIAFSHIPFPYNPHCTIQSSHGLLSEDQIEILRVEKFPKYDIEIRHITLFEFSMNKSISRKIKTWKLMDKI